jgi:hypothetical protein
MPEDLVLVFRTLALLDRVSDRSLARFLATVLRDTGPSPEAIQTRLAPALDGLTYTATGTIAARRLEAEVARTREQVTEEAEAFGRDPEAHVAHWNARFRRFERKRLWCSLRDYVKSPHANDMFVGALKTAGLAHAEGWHRSRLSRAALNALELPGDVWNNNARFRSGLFSPYLDGEPATWNMPRTVRFVSDALRRESSLAFYPEQLDVTFDFVPSMCKPQRCDVCLFGGGVECLCHRRPGVLCSVVLIACQYHHPCDPERCLLQHDLARGLCRHGPVVRVDVTRRSLLPRGEHVATGPAPAA